MNNTVLPLFPNESLNVSIYIISGYQAGTSYRYRWAIYYN